MSSLQILEGLIGTACAVACLYYARQGALATDPPGSPHTVVPWHSALGEYARRNPFAAAFGALALGFLISSWSMYVSPRAVALAPPRTIEKWHTVVRNVPTSDPVQARLIASLENTINTDAATIAQLRTAVDRLNKLQARHAAPRRAFGEAANTTPPAATTETHPAAAEVGAATPGIGAAPPAAQPGPGNAGASPGATGTVPPSNSPPPDQATSVPH